MSEKKGWGSTVMGWFVVREGEEASRAQETEPGPEPGPEPGQEPAENAPSPRRPFARESRPAPTVDVGTSTGGLALGDVPAGDVDFDSVFESAGIDPGDREMVGKAIALLKTLPAGTDPAVRKQIVEASLTAFGVPIDQIIETGAAEIQALEAHIQARAAAAQSDLAATEEKIRLFEEQVAKLRAGMQAKGAEQAGVVKACNDKKLEVQQILEFFGQDAVARVVQASPRLVDPSASR